jgi:hypothetical protein
VFCGYINRWSPYVPATVSWKQKFFSKPAFHNGTILFATLRFVICDDRVCLQYRSPLLHGPHANFGQRLTDPSFPVIDNGQLYLVALRYQQAPTTSKYGLLANCELVYYERTRIALLATGRVVDIGFDQSRCGVFGLTPSRGVGGHSKIGR